MGYNRKSKTEKKHGFCVEDDKIGNHLQHKKNVSKKKDKSRFKKKQLTN